MNAFRSKTQEAGGHLFRTGSSELGTMVHYRGGNRPSAVDRRRHGEAHRGDTAVRGAHGGQLLPTRSASGVQTGQYDVYRGSSLIDIALITGLVVLWPGARALSNDFFVMYFPVLLAFAFVMQPRVSLAYTAIVLGVYGAVTFAADPGLVTDVDKIETLVTRLITLGAIGALGAYSWRIQRDRRRDAVGQAA